MGCVNIYGVDVEKEFNAVDIRNAIIICFKEAHKEILENLKEVESFKSNKEFDEMKTLDIKFLVENAFKETGGDFDAPNKESLIKVMLYLKEYAANFRSPEIINQHAKEMMQLMNKLK